VLKKKRNKKPQHRVHRDTQRYTEVKDDNREVPLIEGERGYFSAPQICILCGTLWYSVISVLKKNEIKNPNTEYTEIHRGTQR